MRFMILPASLLLTLAQLTLADPIDVNRCSIPVYRWMNPFPSDGLVRRQSGYHPEFGGCDYTGTTCEEACGSGYEGCAAGTNLALFCYDPTKGQNCCPDDSGRACDRGFYCAQGRDRTWCCPEGLSLQDCEAMFQQDLTSVNPSPPKTPSTASSSTTTTTGGDGDDRRSPGATKTETETRTETVTVGGTAAALGTTVLASLTQVVTETLTITLADESPGSGRAVTVTSEITIVLGPPCAAGEVCTAGDRPVVARPTGTSTPVVILPGGAVRGQPDAFGIAVIGLAGFLNWAIGAVL